MYYVYIYTIHTHTHTHTYYTHTHTHTHTYACTASASLLPLSTKVHAQACYWPRTLSANDKWRERGTTPNG